MVRVTIYWVTRHEPTMKKIRERFGLSGMSINGETIASIKEEDLPLLRETESYGYIQIRNK